MLTSSLGHNQIDTAKDMLAILRQIRGQFSGKLVCRFGRINYEVKSLAEACISSKKEFMVAKLLKCAAVYGLIIIPDAERDIFKNFMKCHEQATHFTSIDIVDLTQKDMFPNIHKPLQILFTVPQTSVVAVERMFSAVKRIKTRIRPRMGTIRLIALSLNSIERELNKILNKHVDFTTL